MTLICWDGTIQLDLSLSNFTLLLLHALALSVVIFRFCLARPFCVGGKEPKGAPALCVVLVSPCLGMPLLILLLLAPCITSGFSAGVHLAWLPMSEFGIALISLAGGLGGWRCLGWERMCWALYCSMDALKGGKSLLQPLSQLKRHPQPSWKPFFGIKVKKQDYVCPPALPAPLLPTEKDLGGLLIFNLQKSRRSAKSVLYSPALLPLQDLVLEASPSALPA